MNTSKGERILALLDRVSDRVTPARYEDVATYIHVDEWQLAVELLADSLEEQDATLTAVEWVEFSELASSVSVDTAYYAILRTP